jgi:hypothetical protein
MRKAGLHWYQTLYPRDLPYAFSQYVQATSVTMDNSMKPRTFSAITLMLTGSGNGSLRIMNLNTGKVCRRTPSQLIKLPMPQEWIEILVLWANVSTDSSNVVN